MRIATAETVLEILSQQGIRSGAVSINHLSEIREAVRKPVESGEVSKLLSENWHFYLDHPVDPPDARTIIITALPQSILRYRFSLNGKTYSADVAPNYIYRKDEDRTEHLLKNILEPRGFTIVRARLPLKTLAARSGLARYGRNNITYIPEIGSFYRLMAFYTDCPLEKDRWQEPEMLPECQGCSLCRDACTMSSITPDRFLIHAENCLGTKMNDDGNYPHWVAGQPKYREAFIGCLLCQLACPVNRRLLDTVFQTAATFDENETRMLLDAMPLEELPEETKRKLGDLSAELYRFYAVNLKALIEKQDN